MKITKDIENDPMWDTVGITSCDFRPHFDGNLINIFTCILPRENKQNTEVVLEQYTREIADWILSNKKQFTPGDRFQIIIGWPKEIRETDRQIIKTGGDYDALETIRTGITPIIPRIGWSDLIFKEKT